MPLGVPHARLDLLHGLILTLTFSAIAQANVDISLRYESIEQSKDLSTTTAWSRTCTGAAYRATARRQRNRRMIVIDARHQCPCGARE